MNILHVLRYKDIKKERKSQKKVLFLYKRLSDLTSFTIFAEQFGYKLFFFIVMSRFLNDNEMGVQIGNLLLQSSLTLATAESCTGGTIASMVTAVAGSSKYFKGGIVSYAVSVKEQVLGVLLHDGVVSEDTALQMALGAARVCNSDCAVATTGVAGPGGSEGKEQGTVCMAVIWKKSPNELLRSTKTFVFKGDRESVILQAADAALRLLVAVIQEKKKENK